MTYGKYFRYGVLIAIVGGVLAACQAKQAGDRVCYRDRCVSVELAYTNAQRIRGLQDRRHLADDRGMLFVFQQRGQYAFWMKDTLIPLDMIWLDDARRVVHIAADVPPCRRDPCPSYSPDKPAVYVLEVNAGKAARMGLQVGDQMDFRMK